MGLWHEGGDPAKMRFDYDASVGADLAAPPSASLPVTRPVTPPAG